MAVQDSFFFTVRTPPRLKRLNSIVQYEYHTVAVEIAKDRQKKIINFFYSSRSDKNIIDLRAPNRSVLDGDAGIETPAAATVVNDTDKTLFAGFSQTR